MRTNIDQRIIAKASRHGQAFTIAEMKQAIKEFNDTEYLHALLGITVETVGLGNHVEPVKFYTFKKMDIEEHEYLEILVTQIIEFKITYLISSGEILKIK